MGKQSKYANGKGLSASVVNGKIYAIGGYDGNKVFSMVEEYNPKTDTWEKKTNMPTARAYFSTSVVNNKIYAIGGLGDNCFPTVEEYDPVTDKWTRKADMPTARGAFTACVVNNKIYAIGGQMFGVGNYTNVVEVYDPTTDKWEKEANMPTARGYYSACEVNGKIYVIGGSTIQQSGNDVSTVEEYTPEGGQAVSPSSKLPTKWGKLRR
jgi:N-acetylneuraminic acid mutarotase